MLSVASPLEDVLMSQAAICKSSHQKVCQMAWGDLREEETFVLNVFCWVTGSWALGEVTENGVLADLL